MAEQSLLSPQGPQDLRAHFGDRKLDISRKITACVACRKQKIKCHMPNSEAPCSRCRKRGLSCTTNRSLQMLLEDDAAWKQSVTRKIQALEAVSDTIRQRLAIPDSENDNPEPGVDTMHDETSLLPVRTTNPAPSPRPQRTNWEVRMDVDNAATIPANCVGEILQDKPDRSAPSRPKDIVSEEIVTQQQLETLFKAYAERLDHYLYHILEHPPVLSTIRSRSPLLIAAICSVGSLHTAELGHLFDRCYDFFVTLSSHVSMSNKATLDDIRGLIIGAFWLHEVSWNLISIAVRAASQIHLHRVFEKAVDGDRLSYIQTRLWYHLYICDHHFSVAYGRPPLVRDTEPIISAKRFLESRHAVEDDARLISQVEIWYHASCTLDTFGFDVNVPVPSTYIPRLRRCMITLDTWRADWGERFTPNKFVGEYPRKGVSLHYYFARLYLCSHAFRGLAVHAQQTGNEKPRTTNEADNSANRSLLDEIGLKRSVTLHPELEEITTAAVHSARSILRTIIADSEIQSHLQGLPLYFDTMLVFAVVFLLKVSTQYADVVFIDKTETLALVEQMSSTLNSITVSMHKQHLLVPIAQGVEKLVQRCRLGLQNSRVSTQPSNAWDNRHDAIASSSSINIDNQAIWDDMLANSNNWGFDTVSFDLLANQSTVEGSGQWTLGPDFYDPGCWR